MFVERVAYLLRPNISILNKFSKNCWIFKKKRTLECIFGREWCLNKIRVFMKQKA